MAEDEGAKSKKLFKSKWGRVFKEKEEHEVPAGAKHTNSFKLNDDVADFLKPSTDKAATRAANLAPKIDIAIAQRFPEANQVRQVTSAGTGAWSATTPGGLNGFTKLPRRQGLQVGFAKTAPEIMGEGGDECLEPVVEIGKRKAVRGRSVSDMRQFPAMANVAAAAIARQGSGRGEEEFKPPPMRRTQTSGEEYTPNVQRPQYSPPAQEPDPFRRPSRTPTGLGSDSREDARSSVAHSDESPSIPRIDTQFDSPPSSRHGPPSAKSPAFDLTAERRRSLRASEGMALRRASAMIMDESADVDRRASMNFGVQPPPELYETLSREDAEDIMPEVPESAVSPQSARSPDGPSPFADPKYMKSRSREVKPDDVPIQEPAAVQSLRQPRQAYQPSYMRAAVPAPETSSQPQSQQTSSVRPPIPRMDQARSSEDKYQPSYMRAAQAQAPPPQAQPTPAQAQVSPPQAQRPPIPQFQHSPPDELADQRFQPHAVQQQYQASTAPPPPSQSQSMNVPQLPLRERSRSPMHDRMFDNVGSSEKTTTLYARPNASNTSINFSMPSPRLQHSRNHSHDSTSGRVASAESDHRKQMSPRFQQNSQSPQNSPRTSMLGYPGTASPYGRGASPSVGHQDVAAAARGQYSQPPRSPAYMQQQHIDSRPSSSSSNPPPFAVPKPTGSPTSKLPIFRNRQSGSRPPSSGSTTSPPGTGYFQSSQGGQPQPVHPSVGHLREADAQRPGSSGSVTRPAISPQPPVEGNPQADLAFADFATRVAHMKGVFRLTAEKERPADRCTTHSWLRTALWWYGRGKAGLEVMLQHRSRDGQVRERLEQPHVDLAKAWWILADPLEPYDTMEDASPQSAASNQSPDLVLRHSIAILRNHLKSLSLSMGKSQLMPPPQSLIQGQDTRIWLEYPDFAPDAAAALGGMAGRSYMQDQSMAGLAPLDALPLSDSRDTFCYGRFLVDVSMSTDEANTDRVGLPCTLTMLRGKRDFLTTVVIASQNELVNVRIGPRQGNDRSLSWSDVTWKGQSSSIGLRLPHGFDLVVRMRESDFKSLWNLAEYARKVEHNLRAGSEETLIHESRLAEMQYMDSSGSNAFPTGKVKDALALVFERHAEERDGSGTRKVHRGYRLVLLTEPSHKSLSSVTHQVGHDGPIVFEMITDSAAGGMAALVLRFREEQRQCRSLLVFPDVQKRQAFYDILNGLAVGPEEHIIGKMSLATLNIEPATTFQGFSDQLHPTLKSLQWQKLGITNGTSEDSHARSAPTIMSESLRLLARHSSGCITDRLNLSKGELLLRLPCGDIPAIQILRGPQQDLTISIDERNSPPGVPEGIAGLYETVRQQSTIRTLHFASHDDLHAFQAAVTGCHVRYDGVAASFGIKRRMMYVPIHQKWEAATVRLQVVAHGGVVHVVAFMEGFAHADAMCFQVKSTDAFESVKGDGKGRKWGVRMVEAKFALPPALEKEGGKEGGRWGREKKEDKDKDKEREGEAALEGEALEARVRRRFVNLEGLEYMGEHDDITVGFETQEGESGPVSPVVFCGWNDADLSCCREGSIRGGLAGGGDGGEGHYAEETDLGWGLGLGVERDNLSSGDVK